MATLRNERQRKVLLERVGRLRPEAAARWGRLDAPRMVCHLNDVLATALGEVTVPPLRIRILRHFPVKQLAIYILPMPKGASAPADFLATVPGAFAADRARVAERLERLAAAPRGRGPDHPLFGRLSYDAWNRLQWKHVDHHLRQFGV